MQKIGDIPNTRADSNGEFTDGNVAWRYTAHHLAGGVV
ncbi:bacteriophage tail fiber protein [Yersinia ruckeri]|uniref:Bacteriophage tail fiber protein n=1 Tax=Yersinia ruckeri TaxID=29486 RepID=A0A380QTP3_YERRU|nr:bacteriophage tail fiber protein [Yersinia ruckeri]